MIQNFWYAILSSDQVKKDRILAVRRLGMNLVLFRDTKGRIQCLEERCSHRGASLSLGRLQGDCIACPFHGIQFKGNGECHFIPALGIADPQNNERFNLHSYKVREYRDIVFLWLGDEEPDRYLPFFDEELDNSYSYSQIKDEWSTHYSRAIENQLDVIHLPFVHHNTIGRGNRTLVNGPKVLFDDEVIQMSANNEKDLGQRRRPESECEMKSTYIKFRFPNIWLNHITDNIKVLIFFAPVDDGNTILYLRFYNRLTCIPILNRFIGIGGSIANRIIERQDRRVVQTQLPKKSEYRSGENLIPGDIPVIIYRRYRDSMKQKEDMQE